MSLGITVSRYPIRTPTRRKEKTEGNLRPMRLINLHHNEIYGDKLSIGLVAPDGQIVLQPSSCRDYIQDVYCQNLVGGSGGWKKLDTKAEWHYIVLVMGRTKTDMTPYVEPTQQWLNLWARRFKIPLSAVELAEGDSTTMIVRFHRKWIKTPMLLSMFTLQCRLGPSYNGTGLKRFLKKVAEAEHTYTMVNGNYRSVWNKKGIHTYHTSDSNYVRQVLPRLLRMATTGAHGFGLTWTDVKGRSHSSGGIVSTPQIAAEKKFAAALQQAL